MNQTLLKNNIIDLGDAHLITLGHPGTDLEGYGFPWPNTVDLN